ncbi:MAG: hypothetical protein K0R59_2538 [Sphingobacterium sp.]|jgi:hypothetical protein|nr:hypothetical protein [Sphingobacterium sp.]
MNNFSIIDIKVYVLYTFFNKRVVEWRETDAYSAKSFS